MIEKMKKIYETPTVKITRVIMENSIAQTVPISAAVYLQDWEEGGVLGVDTPVEGGDIHVYQW